MRRLWCLNLTSSVVTIYIFKERSILINNLLLALLPLFLQTYHIFASNTKDCRFTWNLAMISSMLSSLVCLILICVMISTSIQKIQMDAEIVPWAPPIIVKTWRLMYHLETIWQQINMLIALIANIVFMKILVTVQTPQQSFN